MLLEQILPELPKTPLDTFIHILALLGIILLVYAVFIGKEHREDLVRFLGALFLNVYAIIYDHTIFIIAMSAVMIATATEFIEIMIALRKKDPETLKKLKKKWRI